MVETKGCCVYLEEELRGRLQRGAVTFKNRSLPDEPGKLGCVTQAEGTRVQGQGNMEKSGKFWETVSSLI